MDGENEKGKRERARRGEGGGQADDNLRVRASVSGKGGGRRRRKANGKVCASKQVSTLSLSKLFLASILGFSRPNMNRSASTKANTMEVWCPAAISFDFFCDFKNDFVSQSNQTTAHRGCESLMISSSLPLKKKSSCSMGLQKGSPP